MLLELTINYLLPCTAIGFSADTVWKEGASAETSHLYMPAVKWLISRIYTDPLADLSSWKKKKIITEGLNKYVKCWMFIFQNIEWYTNVEIHNRKKRIKNAIYFNVSENSNVHTLFVENEHVILYDRQNKF